MQELYAFNDHNDSAIGDGYVIINMILVQPMG